MLILISSIVLWLHAHRGPSTQLRHSMTNAVFEPSARIRGINHKPTKVISIHTGLPVYADLGAGGQVNTDESKRSKLSLVPFET